MPLCEGRALGSWGALAGDGGVAEGVRRGERAYRGRCRIWWKRPGKKARMRIVRKRKVVAIDCVMLGLGCVFV